MRYFERLSIKQILWISISFLIIAIATILTFAVKDLSITWAIILIILTQLASCFFFPIIVGQSIDIEKEKRDFGAINSFYQDFSEGGIIQVYKDREQSTRSDNGEVALKKAFEDHESGEVKLIGVTLRVFFNQTGPFYNNIESLCIKSKVNSTIGIKALINSESAPETINRGDIESPNQSTPTIITEMRATKQHINRLNSLIGKQTIIIREYDQAPYCTAIIFPDKCFISQNLLCDCAPVRLPLIVFRKDSHGYEVLNRYFEYLWERKRAE